MEKIIFICAYIVFSPLFILLSPIGLIVYLFTQFQFSSLNPKYNKLLKEITLKHFFFKSHKWLYLKEVNNVEFLVPMQQKYSSNIEKETQNLYKIIQFERKTRGKEEQSKSELIEMDVKELDLAKNIALVNSYLHDNVVYRSYFKFTLTLKDNKMTYKMSLWDAIVLYPYREIYEWYSKYQSRRRDKNIISKLYKYD